MANPFLARFRSRCAADCGRPIEVDDSVVYVDDELIHAEHLADGVTSPLSRQERSCSECFTIHAGQCAW